MALQSFAHWGPLAEMARNSSKTPTRWRHSSIVIFGISPAVYRLHGLIWRAHSHPFAHDWVRYILPWGKEGQLTILLADGNSCKREILYTHVYVHVNVTFLWLLRAIIWLEFPYTFMMDDYRPPSYNNDQIIWSLEIFIKIYCWAIAAAWLQTPEGPYLWKVLPYHQSIYHARRQRVKSHPFM